MFSFAGYNQILTNAKFALKRVLATSLPKEIQIYNSYIKYITTMNYTIIGPFIVAGLLVCSEGVYFIIHQSQQWTLQQQKYAGNLLKELHPNKNRKLAPSHPILLKYVLVSCVEDLTEIKCFAGDYEYVSNVTVFIESSTTSALLCGQLYIMTKDCTGIYALWSVVTIGMLWNYYWHANEILYKKYVDDLLKKSEFVCSSELINHQPDLLKSILVSCSDDLTEVKLFSSNYEYVSTVAVFIESATISALLCVQLYIMSKDFSAGYGLYELWSMATVAILWIYYWHANEISHKSNGITNALYSFNWYEIPLPLQKDIAVFMFATMKPITMRSGFIHMNTNSFFMLLKTSYTYFTLLQNFTK
ncbi:unnamed protein product [Hermetia illucens]|uniref:Odorant receptor n=1 Tax=Hermetia illucens TaxID=343691 RepID=A0A7R8YLK9_HERIL|nr:unnamed protein product [Hermetia illucens]